jgi:PTH1 family peptidyl-tRNA hydrolase
MKLIVGLGNPGKEYVGTRHNVGFEVIDALATRLGWVNNHGFDQAAKSAFEGLIFDGMLNLHSGAGMEKIVLLKPMTYMNVSGRSVSAAMNFFKLSPSEVLVVVDEMALPVGKIRLRGEGSDGGHNGLKSVQQMLGSTKYPRLRIGVGTPPPPIAGRDWVLGRFNPDEKPLADASIVRAAGCCVTWADDGLNRAMNLFNVEETPESDRSKASLPAKRRLPGDANDRENDL